ATLGVQGNPALIIPIENGEQGGIIPGPSLQFFLSNTTIKIEGDANTIYKAKVSGGKANNEWADIKPEVGELTEENWTKLKEAHEKVEGDNSTPTLEEARELNSKNAQKINELQEKFIESHPNSLVSMYFLSGMINALDLEELKTAYENLGEEHKNSPYSERITDKIEGMEATAIGKEAPPIQREDLDGQPVTLERLSGQYVLIDFWGSWCMPCVKSFPHLKDLYAKYKDE